MTREELERVRAEEAARLEDLKEYEEQNYIQWLRDIKPKWTEEQILASAGKHFNKSFLPEKEEVEKPKTTKKAVKKEGK